MNNNSNNSNHKNNQREHLDNQRDGKETMNPSNFPEDKDSTKKKVIRSVKPFTQKNLDRENELRRMGKWNQEISNMDIELPSNVPPKAKSEKEINPSKTSIQQNTGRAAEISPPELSKEKAMNMEVEKSPLEAWKSKNTKIVNGIKKPISQTFKMNNHSPAYKTSNVGETTQNQNWKISTDKLNNAANRGALLYVIAALLVIFWAVGFFYYNIGATIHLLLVLALAVIVIKNALDKNY